MKRIISIYPVFVEQRYRKELLYLVKKVSDYILSVTYEKKAFLSLYRKAIRNDDVVDELEKAKRETKKYAESIEMDIIKKLVQKVNSIEKFNQRLNEPIEEKNPKKRSLRIAERVWIKENITLIKSITDKMIENMMVSISQSIMRNTSVDDAVEDVKKSLKPAENRAKIIARDQIGKVTAQSVKERNLSRGVTIYEWSSSGDERVRPSHQVMNGKICSWLDPTVYKDHIDDKVWKKRANIGGVLLHPREDIKCRCSSYNSESFIRERAKKRVGG